MTDAALAIISREAVCSVAVKAATRVAQAATLSSAKRTEDRAHRKQN